MVKQLEKEENNLHYNLNRGISFNNLKNKNKICLRIG